MPVVTRSQSRAAAAPTCAICQGPILPRERSRRGQRCIHTFHAGCIENWIDPDCSRCHRLLCSPMEGQLTRAGQRHTWQRCPVCRVQFQSPRETYRPNVASGVAKYWRSRLRNRGRANNPTPAQALLLPQEMRMLQTPSASKIFTLQSLVAGTTPIGPLPLNVQQNMWTAWQQSRRPRTAWVYVRQAPRSRQWREMLLQRWSHRRRCHWFDP